MTQHQTYVIPFNDTDEKNLQRRREFSKLRKKVFKDQLGWDLHNIQNEEHDQYDCSWAVYIIVENLTTGRIEGGARVLRTDRESYLSQLDEFPTSYMLRDAFLGRLDGLPASVTFCAPPQDSKIWELTRLVGEGEAGKVVMAAVNRYLVSQGATECLALSSPLVFRTAQKMGFDPQPIGAMQSNESGRFQAYRCIVDYNRTDSFPESQQLRAG